MFCVLLVASRRHGVHSSSGWLFISDLPSWFSHMRIPFRDKMETSAADIQCKWNLSRHPEMWALHFIDKWGKCHIPLNLLGFFYLPVFLYASWRIGIRGHSSLHLYCLELLCDKYHDSLGVTILLTGQKQLVICSVSQSMSHNVKKELLCLLGHKRKCLVAKCKLYISENKIY